jgi:hypothetical protein
VGDAKVHREVGIPKVQQESGMRRKEDVVINKG